jgi:hypothetical protein
MSKEFKERNQVKKDVELIRRKLKRLPFVSMTKKSMKISTSNVFTSGADGVDERGRPVSRVFKQDRPHISLSGPNGKLVWPKDQATGKSTEVNLISKGQLCHGHLGRFG